MLRSLVRRSPRLTPGTLVRRVGAGATVAAAVAAPLALPSSSTPPSALWSSTRAFNYAKTRVVTDSRITSWCKRLWELSRQHGNGMGSSAAAAAAAATARGFGAPKADVDDVEGAVCDASSAPHGTGSIAPEDLMAQLRKLAVRENGRMPSVLADAVWDVYDEILPPEKQLDLRHTLTPETMNTFFEFIHLLTELDIDLHAVTEASHALQRAVEQYTLLLDETKEMDSLDSDDGDGAAQRRRSYVGERMVRAKGMVVKCCFDARNAGSPLYYTWLRHTASLENGIRRLMDFRKTVHFFDIECKKRIGTLRKELEESAITGQQVDASAKETELTFWIGRQRDMSIIDSALAFLFHDFFSKEYLVMEELTWFSTPPSLLEQIMSAESVHPFHRGLVDMKERLQPTHHRHLFAFLHPAVVEEPLIAVQVALTKGIANSVDHILRRPTPLADPANKGIAAQSFQAHAKKYGVDSDDQERVDTAIFYSINSAQSALRGMDMGNMLIKRVVREIEENINATRGVRNLPAIVTFSTLSPIPGYTRWLSGEVEFLQKMVKSGATKMTECTRASSTGTPQSPVFGTGSVLEQERRFFGPVREAVTGYLTRHAAQLGSDEAGTCEKIKEMTDSGDLVGANAQTIACLLRLFRAPDPADAWWLDFTFTQQLEVPLLRSIAHYLFEEKKRKRILDPVGNFHVSNGAIMYRLNFQGNATPQGSHESACVMVNYLYDMNSISTNVQNYEVDKTVACGEQLTKLLTNED